MTDDQQALKERVRADWNRQSTRWRQRRLGGNQSFQALNHRLFALAGIRPGDNVLDGCCGTGEVSLAIAEAVGPRGQVTGFDLSPGMLEGARQNLSATAYSNVSFREMDAENLDFPDDTFDAVIVRWGVMFFLSPLGGLGELRRVLKPGRRLAISVWGAPERNPNFLIAGRVFGPYQTNPPPPPAPGRPGPLAWSAPGTAERFLGEAGFQDILTEDVEVEVSQADSIDDAVSNCLGFSTEMIDQVLSDHPSSDHDGIRTDLATRAKAEFSRWFDGAHVRVLGLGTCAAGAK